MFRATLSRTLLLVYTEILKVETEANVAQFPFVMLCFIMEKHLILVVNVLKGLAYVDFCDDAHLEAAVAKNRQWLLKKKLSIARSDPSKSKNQSGMKFLF